MKDADISSNYRKGDKKKEAFKALDKIVDAASGNGYFHTKCGSDEWWSASFGGQFMITGVRITNRVGGHTSTIKRLSKAEVTIEGQLCGNLPDRLTKSGEKIDLTCETPIVGTNIMVRNTMKTCLHFTNIEVFGHRMDANGSRGLNVVALHSRDHSTLMAKSYDTYADPNASDELLKDLKGVRRGSILLVSVRDEASHNLSSDVKDYFKKLGSRQIGALAFRQSWSFIGIKGQAGSLEKLGVDKETKTNKLEVDLGYAKRRSVTRTKKEIAAGSSIEVFSAGTKAGAANSYAEIRVNGQDLVGKKSAKRGLNVVVLNGPDHKIILNQAYNLYTKKKNDSARFVKDFKSIPAGSVVIAAVKDDASQNMSPAVRKIFVGMGSQAAKRLAFGNGWGFLGIKGMKKSGEDTGVTVEFATVLSYTKTVKKRTVVEKVTGGSKI